MNFSQKNFEWKIEPLIAMRTLIDWMKTEIKAGNCDSI